MNDWIILLPILIPAIAGVLVFLTPKKGDGTRNMITLAGSAASLAVTAVCIIPHRERNFQAGWAGFGMDFSLRLYQFSAFIAAAAAVFTFLILVYSAVFMKGKESPRQFCGFVLLTLSFATGAVLSNNLILLLFFWEGLLAMMFALIMTGGAKAIHTAVKALILNCTADLCLMLGAGVAIRLSGTMAIDRINLPLTTFWGGFAFVMMMIGAIAKAGSFPFHTWIPDAALDTPLPFMAFLPGALEKLLGIYLLTRVSLDLFQFQPGSGLSILMMAVGACTIFFAVMMALIQKDYKRLLSYHAVSQVGYMILGIGTALPIGIVGGLFHMINNAMYKSCLFLTAGSVERQTGTTDIRRLGGIGRKMPLTCAFFLIAAASIAGVPPFNGFFSKELVFDAALESNVVFYIVAVAGAFFTAASFLKLGHAVYFGKASEAADKAREVSWPMLAPMGIIALGCILFGVYNPLPLRGFLEPVVGSRLGRSAAGPPSNWALAIVSVIVLGLAVWNHFYGVKKSGKASGASDHIHYAPVLKTIYGWAEARLLDPYEIGMKLAGGAATALFAADRAVDWVYTRFIAGIAVFLSGAVSRAHTGKHWMYTLWMIGGVIIVAIIFTLGI